MYQKDYKDVIKEFNSDVDAGLSELECNKRREEVGYNELQGKKKQSLLIRFLLQFKDLMIIILIIAGVVSIVIDPNEWIESMIIFIVITINAIIGVVQESKAEKSLEALEKMASPLCKVIREGNTIQIPTRLLVPGDIIVVADGDFIPGDARIIECSNLQVDESALTGESVPVIKEANAIEGDNIALGDMKNMLFSSTYVTKGRGKAIVCYTGMNTQIGQIAKILSNSETTTTPLQDKLNQVGKIIGFLCIGICIGVFILQYFG